MKNCMDKSLKVDSGWYFSICFQLPRPSTSPDSMTRHISSNCLKNTWIPLILRRSILWRKVTPKLHQTCYKPRCRWWKSKEGFSMALQIYSSEYVSQATYNGCSSRAQPWAKVKPKAWVSAHSLSPPNVTPVAPMHSQTNHNEPMCAGHFFLEKSSRFKVLYPV